MAELDILIPHFNDPDGLALSLQSIALQTWTGEGRIVIADDGSAPDHFAKLKSIIEAHPRPVTLLRNSQNRGRPYARNVLLDALESPYAAWLDAGDEWYPNKIEAQFADLKRLENARTPLWITCNWDHREGSMKKLRRQKIRPCLTQSLLSGYTAPYLWTLLASSKSFREVGWFDERLLCSQDFDFMLRFALQGGCLRACSVQEPLCVYYKTHGKYDPVISRNSASHILEKHREIFTQFSGRFARRRLYSAELKSARYAAANSMRKQEFRFLWKAFKIKPLHGLWHLARSSAREVMASVKRMFRFAGT